MYFQSNPVLVGGGEKYIPYGSWCTTKQCSQVSPVYKTLDDKFPLLLTQVDGVNLLRIPARDAYAYGRRLLDVLFTKSEQRASILLTSKKTNKPPLDQQRVHKLFGEFCSFSQCFSLALHESGCSKQQQLY